MFAKVVLSLLCLQIVKFVEKKTVKIRIFLKVRCHMLVCVCVWCRVCVCVSECVCEGVG